MAPELLNSEKLGGKRARPTQPADLYAFGMVIYEVLTGCDPFHDYDLGVIQLLFLISNGGRPKKPGNTEEIGFGSGTWELVRECWRDRPKRRPTIERVLAHLARNSSGTDALRSPAYRYLPPVNREITVPSLRYLSDSPSLVSEGNLTQILHEQFKTQTISTSNSHPSGMYDSIC